MKYLSNMKGLSMLAVLALIVVLSGTHGGVAVMSCDYCKVKEVASTQSDSLDKIVIAENAKTEMIVADNAVFLAKITKDKAIENSFTESTNQVKAYAEKEKSNSVDIAADIELANSVLSRFDQTRRDYELAANSLVNADTSSIGGGTSGRDNEGIACGYEQPVSGAITESGKQFCNSCQRSGNTAKAIG